MDRATQLVDLQLAGGGTSGSTATSSDSAVPELDCLHSCLQRLVTVAVAAVLDMDASSSLLCRLVRQWEVLQCHAGASPSLRLEGVQFATVLLSHPADLTEVDKIAGFLVSVLRERSSLNIEVVRATVSAVRSLVVKNADCVCRNKLDLELLKVRNGHTLHMSV